METQTTNKEILDELRKLKIDINLIKGKFDEGELTDWAKQELKEAREGGKKISHEDVKNDFDL